MVQSLEDMFEKGSDKTLWTWKKEWLILTMGEEKTSWERQNFKSVSKNSEIWQQEWKQGSPD